MPDLTTQLLDAAESRAADRYAIDELGISGTQLMETAAQALAEEVLRLAPNGPLLVAVGKGNNGGDGLAAARFLRERGREVTVRATCETSEWEGDAAAMLDTLPGEPPQGLIGGTSGFSCVLDCVLGTGATGAPYGAVEDGIKLINEARSEGALVVACDVPSGVDASTGEVAGSCVSADATVTFHTMKLGQWINPGKRHAGAVHLADIGIPQRPTESAVASLLTNDLVDLIPQRGDGADKFSAGSVLVIGGSPGLTGAPLLASLGAARGGAGYVTVALPKSLLSAADSQLEVMGLGLAESGEFHCAEGVESIFSSGRVPDAIVIGPGIGRGGSVEKAVEKIIASSEAPVVVDADALRSFAGRPEALAGARSSLVLTPHSGEMASLLGKSRDEVNSHRLAAAHELADRARATVVLKGDDTIVAGAGGQTRISPGGAPALATAGTGDVLGGLIAAYLAKGVDPTSAAGAAVLVHLEAGRIAGVDGPEGVLAGEIAGSIPEARNRLRRAGR